MEVEIVMVDVVTAAVVVVKIIGVEAVCGRIFFQGIYREVDAV